jgi:hypothetical protein
MTTPPKPSAGYVHPTTIAEFEAIYRKEYEQQLTSCDNWIRWCEKRNDTHGMNFHQGMRSALVFNDIKMCQLLNVLNQVEPNKRRTLNEPPKQSSFDHSPDCDVNDANPDGIKKPCNCGADTRLADRLLLVMSTDAIRKAELFDYFRWLEEKEQSERVPNVSFLCLASDGRTCWGKTFAQAVAEAMKHDKDVYEKAKDSDG